MAKQLQIRRGTTAQHASFTGLVGELSVDTDTDQLRVHDGSTASGIVQGMPLGSIIAVATGITGAYTLPSTGAVGVGGWQLCDGASIPGAATLSGTAPTLNDGRFLRGHTHGNVGATGGADTVTISTAQLPVHNHSVSASASTSSQNTSTSGGPSNNTTGTVSANHTHNSGTNTGGHQHGNYNSTGFGGHGGSGINGYSWGGQRTLVSNAGAHHHGNTGTFSANHTHAMQSHTHSYSHTHGISVSASIGNTGSGSAVTVTPKYLNVVYLIRVQ